MIETKLYKYEPDYVVTPGEILEENLEAHNIKKNDLAQRCGLSTKTVSLIINGTAPISPETALCFQRVLGVSANIWSNLEANYRLSLAKKNEIQELAKSIEWATKFPLKQLIDRGLVEKKPNKVEIVGQLLTFFGVGSVKAWEEKYEYMQVSFRCSPSFTSSRESVASWLRIGELCANKVECKIYNKTLFAKALSTIQTMTTEDPDVFEPKMRRLCAEAGVALVFVSELPGTHLSGATMWLNKDKALIILSLRHKREDYFWFCFFHEAGHVLLGSKKSIFLDEMNYFKDTEEDLANEFASNTLISPDLYKAFVVQNDFTPVAIENFAQQLGIASGIVVGRLQHDREINWRTLNELTRKFELIEACS
jgi:addiction module HigA family antidote